MKITGIEPQKNNKSRVSVFVDNKYAFSLDETDAVHLGIKCGMEIDETGIANCVSESNYSKALSNSFNILSVKPHSEKELSDKLIKKGYNEETVALVVDELKSLGYIDDYDYALVYMEYCVSKMWGEKKIRYEMGLKGISPEIIEEVIASVDEYERIDEMKQIIIRRYEGKNLSDMKTKASVVRYFASRGFDYSVINSAIDAAIKEILYE